MTRSQVINTRTDGQLYRQFSRQRYNRYKHQFPRLRESELVEKIIKEWNVISAGDKIKMREEYIENGWIGPKEKDESDSMEDKSGEIKIEARHKKEKRENNSNQSLITPKKLNEMASKKEEEPVILTSNKKKEEVLPGTTEKEEIKAKVRKTKRIHKRVTGQKADSTTYINFYKYYYNKLSEQHPRWSSLQITDIVRLLWKKRTNNLKIRRVKEEIVKQRKPISGWQAFKRVHAKPGVEKVAVRQMWKKLPNESKKVWISKGNGTNEIKTISKLVVIKMKSEEQEMNVPKAAFNFLSKMMA